MGGVVEVVAPVFVLIGLGYGAARLGFKSPDVFRAVSIMGGGPLQEILRDAPRAGRRRAGPGPASPNFPAGGSEST